MSDEIKAIEESAKTIGKGIELASRVGGFIAPLIQGSLEQGIGIFEDKLKYLRWERQLRLMNRSYEFMKDSGFSGVTRPLPLKFAVPLLQGASLEDDDYLQDLWAKLLVNAVNDERIELKRIYIDILERLSPLEGRIIEKVYSLRFEETQHKSLVTYKLPADVEIACEDKNDYPTLNPEIELALINIARMGCISPAKTWGGSEFYSLIHTTLLGKYFYEACTIKGPS
jgi:hypothetical protein